MYKPHLYGSQTAGESALLTAEVLDSDGNAFEITSVVINSSGAAFLVSAQVLDSDGNPFTIFA